MFQKTGAKGAWTWWNLTAGKKIDILSGASTAFVEKCAGIGVPWVLTEHGCAAALREGDAGGAASAGETVERGSIPADNARLRRGKEKAHRAWGCTVCFPYQKSDSTGNLLTFHLVYGL